ncbi:hypothetical protein CASFOL_012542 [Castilleja foliolosa]|uniref:Histone-lysine N-methyltransferase ASHH2 n=1 Tax=Castilleja foliolosa TaxID=1961234 RepID=A0ABD3DI36_9LAMI
MFTETSFDENTGGIKEESSLIDLDLDIGKLCFSPSPNVSSAAMVASDVSVADVLLPAFDSIKFADLPESKMDIANNNNDVASIWEADLHGQKFDVGKDTGISNCSDFAEVVDDIGKLQKPNHPLIVYQSSRRKSARSINCKFNPKSESQTQKPSRNCRKILKKDSVLDIDSLKISRKRRSSFPKQPRITGWGVLGNSLPDFEENGVNVVNIGTEKKLTGVRGVQAKKSPVTANTGKKSVQKSCHPTGHITLKIKIGNQSCGVVHVTKDLNVSEKSKYTERLSRDVTLPHERKLDNVLSSDVSVLSTHLDSRGNVENSSFNMSGDLHQIINHEEGDNVRATTENRCSDAGTSPDSEVINSIQDATVFEKGLQNTQDTPTIPMDRINQKCFTDSVPDVYFGDGSSLSFSQNKSKKGNKKDKPHMLGDCSMKNKLIGAKTTNSAKAPVEFETEQKAVDVSYRNGVSVLGTSKTYLNTNSSDGVFKCPSRCSRMTNSGTPSTSKLCNEVEGNMSPGLVVAVESSKAQAGETLNPCSNGLKLSKCSRAKEQRKSRCDITSKKEKASKGDRNNLEPKHQIDEKADAGSVLGGVENHMIAGNQTSSDLGESGYPSKVSGGQLNSLPFSSGELMDQYTPPRNAWVLCDECQKWRRIPATLADQIEETNSGWTCKDNTDTDFADCSIPQEKSNSEINAELEISDAEEDACDPLRTSNQNRSKAVQQSSSWSLIKSNLFLHRNRKTQPIDEVMVCHCKPPTDGKMGCGAKCLNRMLNIECVRGTCPCAELCSNQQFQKRKYAKLKWVRCGKKGFGLQALDNISPGKFLIEYVGEVLDTRAYEARQKEYALQGHKHFYFMTLNGSEVIDACAKGNLGRFINHSCDPNCRTEKWMVKGEVCVGLFAVRDIKKGEEVTFDYNYVRVFGAAAKKCVCGAPNCRGYIGGDPTNSEVIVQGDSDDDFEEPVITCEDREMKDDWNDIIANSLPDGENKSANEPPKISARRMKSLNVAFQLESITSETSIQKVGVSSATQVLDNDEADNSVGINFSSGVAVLSSDAKKDNGKSSSISSSAVSKVESEVDSHVQVADISLQSVDVMINARSPAQQPTRSEVTALPSKSQPKTIRRKLKYATLGGKEALAKPDSVVKTRLPSLIKKGKLKSNLVNGKGTSDVDKSNAATNKSKNLPGVPLTSHVETVEEKLNELLDTEGGISKRKDASRGYLKLLLLTATSGTNGHGEAIQSNRDLSMILDALLKTKSRTVLVDITNKNGLQMLHNIMKQYRKEFIKTPILRKLLKVLEYLATREILTLEHITGGPPCPGVESFRDSILTLTEHDDWKVHQIARNFRDRWIPRHLRRKCFMETNDGKTDFPQHPNQSRLSSSPHDHSNDQGGKPAEPTIASDTNPYNNNNNNNGTTETRIRKRKSRWDNPAPDKKNTHSRMKNTDPDIPPGFSSPCKEDSGPPGFSSPSRIVSPPCNDGSTPPGFPRPYKNNTVPFNAVLGNLQPKFISSMPVSYGVPFSVMHQFDVVKSENAENWKVAPGFPFHPFPPLPPPRYNKAGPPAVDCNSAEIHHLSGQKRHMESPDMNIQVDPEFQRDGASYNLGRNFFRQQKWNQPKAVPPPPWVRIRNGWVHGGNTRNDTPPPGFGNGANQYRN